MRIRAPGVSQLIRVFDGRRGVRGVGLNGSNRVRRRCSAILSLSVAAATLFACKHSSKPSPHTAIASSPCPPTCTRVPGTFVFDWANEGHTGRVYVLACPDAVTALTDSEWRALMDLFRAAAAEDKKVWPFKSCSKPSGTPSLAPRANEVLRRHVFTDVCFDITASV